MRFGIRKNINLNALMPLVAATDELVPHHYDSGVDFTITWNWQSAEQAIKDGCRRDRIIAVDVHPFDVIRGEKNAENNGVIFQLGDWGALAKYPPGEASIEPIVDRSTPGGPILVLGHLPGTLKDLKGQIDVWKSHEGDKWIAEELKKPNRKFRAHPRELYHTGKPPHTTTLEQDLEGCSGAITWNGTAAVHASLLGWPGTCAGPRGWSHFTLEELAALRVAPEQLLSGSYWSKYRNWLLTQL